MKTQAEYIGEIFLHVASLNTDKEKIEYLQNTKSKALAHILKYAYDDRFITRYMEIPKYTSDDSPIGYSVSGLHKEYVRIPYFLNTDQYIKNDKVRNNKLRNILEMIHWTETPILEAVILKNTLPHISRDLAKTAFPELFTGDDNG